LLDRAVGDWVADAFEDCGCGAGSTV